MADGLSDGLIAAAIGFGGGALLGLAGQLGRFCTLGAIEDAIYGRDFERLRMWSLAIGLSILGAFLAMEAEIFSASDSIYAARAWDPVASILGGLMFGYGMAMAGNCGFGALVRLGGGDIRSLVILIVMGVAAFMAIGGPIGLLRIQLFPPLAATGDLAEFGYAHAVEAATGLSATIVAALIAASLIGLAMVDKRFRTSPICLVSALMVAAAVLSGWAGLGLLAAESFDPIQVESHTFTAPVGETLIYLMTASAGGLGFPVGSVFGVLSGAVAGSLIKGRFRWEACDDPRELGRQMAGAVLMGVGAVLAVGCSVGQGLTAFSLLSFSAPVVALSIFLGAALGLRTLISGAAFWRSG